MRLIFPLVVLMIALAGCAGEVASPAKPAEKPMQVQSATPENPRADLVPGVNVEQPRTETPAAASRTVSYIVEGMHWANCAASVRGMLESLPEVESCTVSNETRLAVIKLKPGATFPEQTAREKLDVDNFKLGAKQAPPVN